MKTICAVQCLFDKTLLGTRSRLAEALTGVPILRRSVQQFCATAGIEKVIVLVSERSVSLCRDLLNGLDVVIQTMEAPLPPWGRLVSASRKWALDGWRGGVGGATVFDEFTDCRVLGGLLERFPADAVLSVPAAAPLFSPELAGQMIEHRREHRTDARLTFTQAVPGVAGIVLDSSLVQELAKTNIPISWLFSYKPDDPRKDLIFQPAFLDIRAPLRFGSGRLIADTDRAVERLTKMLGRQEKWNLADIGQYLVEEDECGVAGFPYEVEIEITTDDSFPGSLLAPRGRRLERGGVMSMDVFKRVAEELIKSDDTLCVLGGFGEPLRHPDFQPILQALRPRNGANSSQRDVFGLCVRTSGVDLTTEIQELLIAHDLDIVNICLDAWMEKTFRFVKGLGEGEGAGLREVQARLESFGQLQHDRQSPVPIVVPEMTKAKENVHELDDFFDGWLRRVGAVSVMGYSHYAGQMPDRSVIDMRPPLRVPCRRLRTRCLVLADGRVALCDQDYKGLHTFGNVRDCSLGEIWQSPPLQAVREQHLTHQFERNPLCAACGEWHRP